MSRLRYSVILGLLYLTCATGFAPSIRCSIPHTVNNVHVNSITRSVPMSSKSTSALFSQEDYAPDEELDEELDDLIVETAKTLRRVNWISWWSQLILSIVSTVTLLFAKGVMQASSDKRSITGAFFFAGSGIAVSFLSIVWTWGGARLSKRLGRSANSRIKAANMIRRTITIGSVLNLSGMFLALIGAQQIVGLLASKLLTMQGVSPFAMSAVGVSAQTLQPIDILIVQANTNTLLSHFISLVCCLVMTRGIDKLDPPSLEDDPR
eukprot:scaffold10591_cov236-Chaetoceros_neogracile.AAC.2